LITLNLKQVFDILDMPQFHKMTVAKCEVRVRHTPGRGPLPVREEIATGPRGRPNWSKSDWNDWHKERTAVAIDYHNSHRSEHLTTITPTGRSTLLLWHHNHFWNDLQK